MVCVHVFSDAQNDTFCVFCGDYKYKIPKTSGKIMCETISNYLKEKCGLNVEPKDIWESSPTGELSYIIQMYRNIKVNELYPTLLEGDES